MTMFEAVEVGNSLDKDVYKTTIADLRVNLINAQYDLRQADFPVIIVLTGNDRIGCNAVLHTLHDIMDSRYMRNTPWDAPRRRSWNDLDFGATGIRSRAGARSVSFSVLGLCMPFMVA